MSDLATRLSKLSVAQRRLLEERLAERKSTAEPIAIVGMGCRFPGARTVDDFWELIRDGVSAVSEVPSSRWDADAYYDPSGEIAGKMSTKWGAFVDDVDQFDPVFFGISPREASRMDPQQRLLLEVAWETIEQAGIPPKSLAGSKTGVFVGIGGTDYSKIPSQFENYLDHVDAHVGTGNALSIAANRISYVYDFRGPSFAVDTACSSAMVALHCAVQSLRSGECDAALAGGVNLILSPEVTIAFSKARMLSADGVCRPFDANANGYVRGEGCGLVLIKRLADAVKQGDQVLGVIRATAINQDGKTSGITAPNSDSQQEVILSALAEAGLDSEQISYVEAHGTATPLGDPIETVALGKLFPRTARDQRPCYMTSVKANIGHTETVSGIAGLIKTLLLMKHRQIPPQLHLNDLNPNLSLSDSRIEIPTELIPWDAGEQRRIAGISSFGFGGTNAHVLVEEPAASPTSAWEANSQHELDAGVSRAEELQIVAISAKSEAALQMQAEQYADRLALRPDVGFADFCAAVNIGRSHFSHRCTILADGSKTLQQNFAVAALGDSNPSVRHGEVRSAKRARVAFLFTGQGSQFPGMGRELYAASPVFRNSLERCDELLSDRLDQSLVEVILNQDDPEALLNETYYTQPALFALEYSLAQLWMSWGVQPDVVMGHSVGEYVAACIAGVFSLEDGLCLIAERGRLMQQLPRDGSMAVVFADAGRIQSHADFNAEAMDIAAINGPENTVVAGYEKDVESFLRAMESEGIQSQRLNVSHAFHSSLMDPILEDFAEVASELNYQLPEIDLVSNLTGKIESRRFVPTNGKRGSSIATPEYWVRHVRESVQFSAGVTALADAKPDLLIEVGPTPQLISMARRFAKIDNAIWVPSLRKGQEELRSMLDGLSSAYLGGCDIAWEKVGPEAKQRVELPTYPFQRSRHWYETGSTSRDFRGGNGPDLHPLLGRRVPLAMEKSLFQSSLRMDRPSYLQDHRVQGSVVLPAAAYLETAMSAAEQTFGSGRHSVESVDILQAMFLNDQDTYWLQTSVAPEQYGGCEFECGSRVANDEDEPAWSIHAKGRIVRDSDERSGIDLEAALTETRSNIVDTKTSEEFYDLVKQRELIYGESFRVLGDSQRSSESAIANLDLCRSVRKEMPQYHLHPALLDACLQLAAQVVPLEDDGSYSPYTYMPTRIGAMRLHAELTDSMQVFARRIDAAEPSPSPDRLCANIYILDAEDNVLVELSEVEIQRLGKARDSRTTDAKQWLYGIDWRHDHAFDEDAGKLGRSGDAEIEVPATSLEGQWLILADQHGLGDQLAEEIEEAGGEVTLVRNPDVETNDPATWDQIINSLSKESLRGVVYLWSLDLA
ncbi:MAG: type I polyketide synthase, partial [Rubripirellula sp.]